MLAGIVAGALAAMLCHVAEVRPRPDPSMMCQRHAGRPGGHVAEMGANAYPDFALAKTMRKETANGELG